MARRGCASGLRPASVGAMIKAQPVWEVSVNVGVGQLIDGMDGIVYMTDAEGTIVAIGTRNWNRFAYENNGAKLVDGRGVIGHSIFDFIEGNEVRWTYHRFFAAILAGRSRRARLVSRCDSPTVKRELWIIITPVHGDHRVEHLLVQSLTVSEQARPPVDLFNFPAVLNKLRRVEHLPILSMCSYCQDVRAPGGCNDADGAWMSAELYYRRGGDSNVRISHGRCPRCAAVIDKALAGGALIGLKTDHEPSYSAQQLGVS